MMKFWALGASLLAPSRAHSHNCFVLLGEPLPEAPFSNDEVARLLEHFKANLNVNGTGAIIASPGDTPALPPSCVGGYRYHWMRDGALSIATLEQLATVEGVLGSPSVSQEYLAEVMKAYAGWVSKVHSAASTTDVFGEPKWVIDQGIPYPGGWCRPQTDGPPLRARSLLAAAKRWPENRDLFWNLARMDLDWLAPGDGSNGTNIERVSCDLWEETQDGNFLWNRVVMRAALLEGIDFAMEVGDTARATSYQKAVENFIGDPFADHQKRTLLGSFATECPAKNASSSCEDYKKTIDGAVILSLIHGRPTLEHKTAGGQKFRTVPLATSQLAANTVKAYNEVFCRLYAVNQADSQSGVPGVLYGRYAADKYGNDDGGNPWVLITGALASLLYQAAQIVAAGGALSLKELAAWKAAFNLPLWGPFSGTAREFIAAGDSVLARIRKHVHDEDEMHLYEQIDRNSGRQYNAKDLTWSYGEVLTALVERARAVGEAPGFLQSTPLTV